MEEKIIAESKRSAIAFWVIGIFMGITFIVGVFLLLTMKEGANNNPYKLSSGCSLLGCAFLSLLSLIILSKRQIIVTDKRVIKIGFFGSEKTLPIQFINSIAVGWFGSIHIATSSGRIGAIFLADLNSIYLPINKLILLNNETVVKEEQEKKKEQKDNTPFKMVSQPLKCFKKL